MAHGSWLMARGFAGGHPWRRKVTEITLPVRLILNEPSRCCQELAFTEHQRCARVGGPLTPPPTTKMMVTKLVRAGIGAPPLSRWVA